MKYLNINHSLRTLLEDKEKINKEHTELMQQLKEKEWNEIHRLQEKMKARYAEQCEKCSKYRS